MQVNEPDKEKKGGNRAMENGNKHWATIIKLVIALASALLGALGGATLQ